MSVSRDDMNTSESDLDIEATQNVFEPVVVEDKKPELQPSHGLNLLEKIRTNESALPPGPAPDGGLKAWTQAMCGHFIVFNSWGYINGWGVFQSYYTENLPESSSAIAWIGGIQVFLLFFIGTFSGRLTDAGYFKILLVSGVIIQLVGIFMTSLCKEYYQIILAQGVCVGIGNGLTFCPTISVVAPYFDRKRGLAMAVVAAGSGTGGLVYPAVIRQLIPQIGFPWTVRVLGFITLATDIPCIILLKTRVPPRSTGPLVEFRAFKEFPYLFFSISMFFNFWGLYVVFFYLSTFARDQVGMPQASASNLVMILNGVGIPGRLIPNYIADRTIGMHNMFLPVCVGMVIVMYCWIAVHNVAGLYVYAVIYGFFGAGMQALFPGTLTTMAKDVRKTGIRVGMTFSVVSFAALTGSPIAGALVAEDNGGYLYAQLFAGTCMLIGTVLMFLSRWSKDWERTKRIMEENAHR
uniref:ARAD1D49390p n=1 Tax=Blastobotrys adeninivorans TaxID=409370 RepID=A0A060TIU0_BLAAD